MDVILLRFDAPMMSFGAPIVDSRGMIQDHPPSSLLVGLIGNALGYDHREPHLLQRLQSRLRYAVRRDCTGIRLTDFQTVDLGQEHLAGRGWTTRGSTEGRAGGSAGAGTHIRMRDYLADAVFTIAFTLAPAEEDPTVHAIAQALTEPERPLFIGRKTCLPSEPLLLGRWSGESLMDALRDAERVRAPRSSDRSMVAWWPQAPAEETAPDGRSVSLAVTDERDWANQIHGGQRIVRHGAFAPEEVQHGS